MYLGYFGLDAAPFSIVPDHRALYMSQSHREAVAHLLYALDQSGGFVQLTGEVGTGKTTVSRYILANLPQDVDVALLLNPRITEKEMLEAICDELSIEYSSNASQKDLVTRLNDYLLKAHSNGRKTVLILDEAQNLSREVLEQIRLLTNLETSSEKLLQIILIGQPELAQTLSRHDLRQLSQRIVGRFKLLPLNKQETREYIEHRLNICGVQRPLFSSSSVNRIHQLSKGIPRVINVLCDRALLGAYGQSKSKVDRSMVNQASKEVLCDLPTKNSLGLFGWAKYAAIALIIPIIAWAAMEQFNDFQLKTKSKDIAVKDAKDTSEPEQAKSPPVASPPVQPKAISTEIETGNITSQLPEEEQSGRPFDLTWRLGVPLSQEN